MTSQINGAGATGASSVTGGSAKRAGRQGFASMDPVRQREIASDGGRAAHVLGTAHQFTPAEAAEAGRKGGLARARRFAERRQEAGTP